MSHIGFNTSDYEPATDSPGKRVFPAGQYVMIITGDEYKNAKSGKGSGFLFELQICDGENAGTNLKKWINYEHQNQTVQKIGRGELRSIADACGIQNPQETEHLYGIPMLVTLGIEYKKDPQTGQDIPDSNTYEKWEPAYQQPTNNDQQPPPHHQSGNVPDWQSNQ